MAASEPAIQRCLATVSNEAPHRSSRSSCALLPPCGGKDESGARPPLAKAFDEVGGLRWKEYRARGGPPRVLRPGGARASA